MRVAANRGVSAANRKPIAAGTPLLRGIAFGQRHATTTIGR